MNTLSEILNSSYSNQGIQNMEVFFDSYIFNLKIKNGSEYHNVVLIEKLEFDYDTETIKRLKNSISINFGNTESASPIYSGGNGFVQSYLDTKNKIVLLIGLKEMASGHIIPIIYSYNISKHVCSPIFPKTEDINQFNSLINISNYKSTTLPIVRFSNSSIFISFQTQNSEVSYIHKITLRYKNNSVKLTNYEIYDYENYHNLIVLDTGADSLGIKLGNYHAFLNKNANIIDTTGGFCLDDSFSFLSLDNSYNILGLTAGLNPSEVISEISLDNSIDSLSLDDLFSILSIV